MKLPAAELWNKTLPRKFPKIRKNRQHPRPKMKQLPTDCFNKRMIRLLSSDAWAALTAGISTVPIEVNKEKKQDDEKNSSGLFDKL